MKVPFVDLGIQYRGIQPQVNLVIQQVLDSAWFILGDRVRAFEQQFADYLGIKHAVGVGSGTAALLLALAALDVGPGDEVIVPANTFFAAALAVSHLGATPVLADVDALTCNLDPAAVERHVTRRSKAIIPVHLYGNPADMDPLLEIGRRHGLYIVEDACQAHGSEYHGRKAGTLGDVACFSFYPSKNLGAYGDGGMVVTDSSDLAVRLRRLRDYGQSAKYHLQEKGFNSRLDEIQAAILEVKLPYLDEWNNSRRRWAARLNSLLKDTGVSLPRETQGGGHVYHLYVIRVPWRESLQRCLSGRGIGTSVHYPVPIHLQPAYTGLGYPLGSFPVTERLASEVVSLPMYPELTEAEVEYVASCVSEFCWDQTFPVGWPDNV